MTDLNPLPCSKAQWVALVIWQILEWRFGKRAEGKPRSSIAIIAAIARLGILSFYLLLKRRPKPPEQGTKES